MPATIETLVDLPYRPATPRSYAPKIGVIGCGGIIKHHLEAYVVAGFDVVALCDLDLERAVASQKAFYPDAKVYTDYHQVLRDVSIEVVDITTHPPVRPPIIEAALRAGKHVLSQKPFVLDLDVGQRLVELAEKQNCYLAVNQNGRWAPHFSYARLAAASGILGNVFSAHMECHWDHTWVAGTEFEKIKHLVLYDYAIHWFDIVRCFFPGQNAKRVFASTARIPEQTLMPDLLGQALIEFEHAQSTLSFDAGVPYGSLEETYVAGTLGSLHSTGSGNQEQRLSVTTAQGRWSPSLQGKWFSDGFRGTMGELLCAIEEQRPCTISASDNLHSLALCFAAIASAEAGAAMVPGSIRQMPV
ncbi:Gfo/Idh/MocA family protein [Aureliella helgolandensis]|uniref:Inositol 2-dehydrogenase n=1 Tax=Aureliella helgolandensis TaxID=2527968 RepID=A0A518GCB7_9BACT|nr:Gfo/Idh/MocA family oxidoreductase [Aureliella helgolandensis]QDV26246.1 Inositol 2-dehydrogenase [Aureliella helgolandensis]